MRRVVVTGLGLVTPLGVGVKHVWRNLIAARCGIQSLDGRSEYDGLPSRVAGLVPRGSKSEGGWDPKDWLAAGDERRMSLFTQYAIAAAKQALTDANWQPTLDNEKERTGVCCGSGIGSFEDAVSTTLAYNSGGYRKVSPLFVPRLLVNMAAGHLSMTFGFQGPNHAVSTACTTGNHAIGDAARFIQFGDADVMVAGGSEACIHPIAIAGFARAKSLATQFNDKPQEASRPFDRDRDGFVIGEGAGIVVLEALDHALARQAPIYAELSGYGLSSDAHHMTSPSPGGTGAGQCMRRALAHAKLAPEQVDYVNAHATSTSAGDVAENSGIKAALIDRTGRKNIDLAVSSTKGAIGHLLGAAGAVESIFTILALHHGILPPTLNLHNPGPEPGFTLNYVPLEAQKRDIRVALSNSFGFGGTNASLCFQRHDESSS